MQQLEPLITFSPTGQFCLQVSGLPELPTQYFSSLKSMHKYISNKLHIDIIRILSRPQTYRNKYINRHGAKVEPSILDELIIH